MTSSSLPLIELLRNTPPPMVGLQDSVRSIPPPPLCPPPLTILKMVPPPPLPSHLRKCPPPLPLLPPHQVVANTGYPPPAQDGGRGQTASPYQEPGRAIVKGSAAQQGRQMHPNFREPPAGRAAQDAGSPPRDDRSASRVTSGDDGDSGDRSTSERAAELVVVLRNLVNLFTMTSQVKSALSKVRPKADDTGIQHQVNRTRSLVDTFREQLARRTVMLGRLIPPGTNGKPEMPRELRTKDPAGGDVSPQPDPAPSPPDGVTQAAIFSLQALVSGDVDQAPDGASRWGSRVKRRFLAASKPARRHADKLKGPNSSGVWLTPGSVTSYDPSAVSAPKADSSSEEDNTARGGYISPGCYVIDRAGLPRDHVTPPAGHVTTAGSHVTGQTPPAISAFGVPLSVMLSEASKKKKKSGGRAGETAHPVSVEPSRQDRSWRTACDQVPRLLKQSGSVDGALQAAVESLSELRLGNSHSPPAVSTPSSPSPVPVSPSPGSEVARATPSRSGDVARDAAAGRDGAAARDGGAAARDAGTAARDATRDAEAARDEERADSSGGSDCGWLSMSLEGDWFQMTEREEQERRRRAKAGQRL